MTTIDGFINRSKDDGEWKVSVNPRPASWNYEIWLVHRNGAKVENASIENGHIMLTEVHEDEPSDKFQPFMVVPGVVWQLIVDAMTETTKPTKKEAIDAELLATKYHLEDMRKLLKLKV